MGFGLLAGIAGAFPAIQKGMDDQRARDNAEEDRKYQLEQRQAARDDRAFGLSQRDRQVTEQRRQDQLRDDLAAVPQTREVDARPQAVQAITHDDTTGPDDNTPAATQVPATKTVAAPDWMKFKRNADVYRQNKEFEKADAYDALAKKAQFADSAQRFQTLAAGAGAMSMEQLASAATELYNNDPLPAQIKGVRPVEGGLQFTFINSDTGQSQPLLVRSKEELLQKLESYYSPETYASYVQGRRAAAAKAEEVRATERAKPQTTNPGQQISTWDEASGRYVHSYTNTTPTAAQVKASGAGAAKPGQEYKASDDALEFVAKNTGFKEQVTPAQGAEIQRLNRQFFVQNPGIDPAVAAHAAVQAVTDPTKVQPKFDPATGKIMSAMPYEGGHFVIRDLGAPGASKDIKPEQLRALASDFVSSIPEASRTKVVLASFDKTARQQLRNDMEARLRSDEGVAALSRRLGRQATAKDIDAAVESANQVQQRQLDFIGNHGDPDMKVAAKQAAPKAAPRAVGGLAPQPAAADVPVVGGLGLTPAERTARIDVARKGMESKKAAAVADAKKKADAAVAAKDVRAAFAVQSSSEFSSLDEATKMAVYKLVNGLR